ITKGAQRVTNALSFKICPTITSGNKRITSLFRQLIDAKGFVFYNILFIWFFAVLCVLKIIKNN
ncbi:MAG TPA: hypothetical protein PLC35_04400, partial [Methanosarcina vacuolata]|nr:hypothetical protein [Methanosarcina vacuolata]